MAYTDLIALQAVACTTFGGVLFAIKEQLKLAGWVTDGSGDGGALYSDAGVDHITHNGTAAGGFNRANAWWAGHFGTRYLRIQAVSITVGLATTDSTANIYYKKGSGFVYTSANSSTAPTGGDAVAAAQQMVEWTTSTMYVMGACDREGVGAFWFGAWETGSNTSVGMGFAMEEVYADFDPDPVVWYFSGGSNAASPSGFSKVMATDSSNVATALCRAYYNGTWRPAASQAYESSVNELMVDVASYPVSPYDGKLVCQKHGFGTNQTVLRSWKGVGKSLAYYPQGDSVGTARRQLWTHTTANDYIRAINSLLPWDGSVPTFVASWGSSGSIRFVEDAFGAPDTVEPTITVVDPAAGGTVRSTSIITFDVTDEELLSAVAIIAVLRDAAGTILAEDLVHDGSEFRLRYKGAANTRTAITGGYRYTVRRDGGWTGSPTFEYLVVDHGGNLGVIA